MEFKLPLSPCERCGKYTTTTPCLDCRMALEGRSYICLQCGDTISPDTTDEHETADEINTWLRKRS